MVLTIEDVSAIDAILEMEWMLLRRMIVLRGNVEKDKCSKGEPSAYMLKALLDKLISIVF